jgi:hypothetical protein
VCASLFCVFGRREWGRDDDPWEARAWHLIGSGLHPWWMNATLQPRSECMHVCTTSPCFISRYFESTINVTPAFIHPLQVPTTT